MDSKDFSVFRAGGAALRRFLQLGSLLAAIGFAALLGGCGGGSVEGESGDVWVGLTDAAGDFATYTVDVTAITLTKANGEVVETLPLQTTVGLCPVCRYDRVSHRRHRALGALCGGHPVARL